MTMLLRRLFLTLLVLPALGLAQPATQGGQSSGVRGLRNVTMLIVRHAEKPDQGSGLTPQGMRRAEAYATYFDPLRLDGKIFQPQRLIATSDSKSSERPRLTLAPLAARLQLPLEQPYANKDVDQLVQSLRATNQASVVLIAWHHGHIKDLVNAFGADIKSITGSDAWPGDVYSWLIVLHFDAYGQLTTAGTRLVQEHLLPGD